jgi:hypothetical protein
MRFLQSHKHLVTADLLVFLVLFVAESKILHRRLSNNSIAGKMKGQSLTKHIQRNGSVNKMMEAEVFMTVR